MLGNENLPPNVVKRVAKELRTLAKEPIEGVHVNLNTEVLTDINAEINGPEGTPYENGVFRVKLVLSNTFPSQPPKGFFLTPIFHPNVGPNGEICVNTLKRDWSSDHKIKHILIVIRCLLIHPNPDSALNEEAGRSLQENYQEFCQKAQLFTNIHAIRRTACLEETTDSHENLSPSTVIRPKKIAQPSKRRRIKKKKRGGKSLHRL